MGVQGETSGKMGLGPLKGCWGGGGCGWCEIIGDFN